jgi:hypothetical protein
MFDVPSALTEPIMVVEVVGDVNLYPMPKHTPETHS